MKQNAGFFRIMADEVTSSDQESVPLWIRSVHENRDIREELTHFCAPWRIAGTVTDEICEKKT